MKSSDVKGWAVGGWQRASMSAGRVGGDGTGASGGGSGRPGQAAGTGRDPWADWPGRTAARRRHYISLALCDAAAGARPRAAAGARADQG